MFQEAGGRTIEVTNRDYQLRGVVDNDDIDKLEFLVVGRDKRGKPVHLKDIGYFQVGYDQRRGIADLDGDGEVVGGIVIMEQGRTFSRSRSALQQKLEQIEPRCPRASRSSPTYDRSAWIWATLKQFLRGDRLRADRRRSSSSRISLRNLRAAVAPIVRPVVRRPVHRVAARRPSVRRSTCSRSPAWRSPSARSPTRRSSSSRTAPRNWLRRAA